MATKKKYSVTHKSDKAFKNHLDRIKKRGGSATVDGNTINYKFGKGGGVDNFRVDDFVKIKSLKDIKPIYHNKIGIIKDVVGDVYPYAFTIKVNNKLLVLKGNEISLIKHKHNN